MNGTDSKCQRKRPTLDRARTCCRRGNFRRWWATLARFFASLQEGQETGAVGLHFHSDAQDGDSGGGSLFHVEHHLLALRGRITEPAE